MENNKVRIYHNSWEERYRKPSGAVKKGTGIRLFVETEGISKAWLELHKDFGEWESIEMNAVEGGFSVEIEITETVLHYYHFRGLAAGTYTTAEEAATGIEAATTAFSGMQSGSEEVAAERKADLTEASQGGMIASGDFVPGAENASRAVTPGALTDVGETRTGTAGEAVAGTGEVIVYGNNEQEYGGEGQIITPERRLFDYQITVYDYDDFAPRWYREGVAYHIFIDRFAAGAGGIQDPKENIFFYGRKTDLPMYIKDEKGEIIRWDFFGGDLWGIIERLPYLKELGISILYLSPVFTARSNHRYDTGDYMHIEPMIGGEEAFTALIEKAGRLGMKIILDGVFNHCGADSIYFDRYNRYGGGACHNESSPYRQWFHITGDGSYDAWWGVADLPRFNGQDEGLKSFLLRVVSKWSSYGIGGWRLDVADELEDEFIAQLRDCLNGDQVLLGEVWEDPSNKISYGKRRYYVKGGHLHGVMNYPFRECILDYLSGATSAGEASSRFRHYQENFPPHVLYNNLNNLGSHDTIRLMTALNMDIRLVKLSLVFLLMLPGVPCVYYGDEIGLPGGNDPDNRRFFPWGQADNELHQFFQEMIVYRNNNKQVLAFGDLQVVAKGELLAMIRHYEDSWIYASFNPGDREQYLEDPGYGISATVQAKDYLLRER